MRIKDFLAKRGVSFELLPHAASYSGSQLAHATHTAGCAVAKTVLLHANHGFVDVVAVIPATRQVDLAKASRFLGGVELKLGTEEDIASHCPDCERGVLPPFGSLYAMRTIVDESLAGHDLVTFEGERHDEAIRLRFEDFRRLEGPLMGSIVTDAS